MLEHLLLLFSMDYIPPWFSFTHTDFSVCGILFLCREISSAALNPAYVPPRSLDVSEALACPGVVDVITAEDVPGDNNHSGEIFYAQSEVCGLLF